MTQILTPAAAREHLRLDPPEASDEQLASYIAAAEDVVADFLNRPLIDDEKGWASVELLPPTITHAIKLVLTELYDNREAPLTDQVPLRNLIGRHVIVSVG